MKLTITDDSGKPLNGGFYHPEISDWVPKGLHLENSYLDRFSPNKKSFMETGTYKGETVAQMLDYGFEFVRSCDLSMSNLEDQFRDRIKDLVVIGESPECIPVFLAELKQKFPDPKDQEATFWLDAHASGDIPGGKYGGSPVLAELEAIALDPIKTHTIFIDDRRLFGSAEWSFVSEEDAIKLLLKINPDYKIRYLDGHGPDDVIVASVYDNG